jgi:hypothetical protein
MGIIRNALKKQIDDNNRIHSSSSTASIVEYDPVSNTAVIRYKNPNGEGSICRENVSVSNTLGGVTGSGIYPGQTCTITFNNGNIFAPVITGFTGSYYSSKTCADQGAYIVDTNLLMIEKPEKITPMIENWIDENSTTIKYNSHLKEYTNIDTNTKVHKILSTLSKYKPTEQGITNLKTKSTIKFKENGDIDIFVANNIGIRISTKNNSIDLYGKLNINGQEIDLSKILNKG